MNGIEFFLGFVVLCCLFLILRELFCWYWKINRRVDLFEQTSYKLDRIIEILEKKENKKEG